MIAPTSASPSTPQPQTSARDRFRQLQALLLATILSLLVMSLGVNLFLFKQMRNTRAQVAGARAYVQNLSDQYQAKEPAMRQFVSGLEAFAAVHPDFQPVVRRYRASLPQFFNERALVSSNRNNAPFQR